jgi:hypothetical protein
LWHLSGKLLIAAWAAFQRPAAEVVVDSRRTPAGAQPDVWVRCGEAGDGQVVFELQRSPLTVDQFNKRVQPYQQDQLPDNWLFASIIAPTFLDDGQAGLNEVHRIAAGTGPVRWLNPIERTVATGYVNERRRLDARTGERWRAAARREVSSPRQVNSADRECWLRIDSIDDCRLDEGGMRTPTDDWLAEQLSAADALEESLRAQSRAEWVPPAPQAPFEDPPAQPAPASRPAMPAVAAKSSFDPLAQPCPWCKGRPTTITAWPHWYRPPAGTTLVVACSSCDLILGSIDPA